MKLEELYGELLNCIKETTDIDEIMKILNDRERLSNFTIVESDQEIDDFLKEREENEENKKLFFSVIQKIKIENSIEKISDDVENDEIQKNRDRIRNLFGNILEPDSIIFNEQLVSINYALGDNSRLNSKLKEIEKWEEDNVRETIADKLGVPIERIVFINSVSSYIEFISDFSESTYVSRGQKDCSFELKPSLYRIYENSYAGHSSDYEEAFRQKILFYDGSTENKKEEEIRAYGQHFGLPTNYLDFTEAHLISLLFAVEEYDYVDNHSIVYFVDSRSYNRETIKEDRKLIDFSDEELKRTVEKQGRDKSYFIKVGNCNERIHFQKGCFLKVEQNDDLRLMYEKYTRVAVIDKNSKESILMELFKLGITFENIYPDKDNMVKTIRFIKEHM